METSTRTFVPLWKAVERGANIPRVHRTLRGAIKIRMTRKKRVVGTPALGEKSSKDNYQINLARDSVLTSPTDETNHPCNHQSVENHRSLSTPAAV